MGNFVNPKHNNVEKGHKKAPFVTLNLVQGLIIYGLY